MENGINESLQGANDALKSALDYLTSIETKIKSIRKETEEVGKSATKFAKGTQKASDAGGAAGVGGSRSMKDWYQGIKDGFAKITGGVSQDSSASKSSTDSGKTAMGMPVAQVNTGGGGGKSGSPAAAAPTSSGSTGANPVSNFSLPTAVGAVGVAAAAGLWDATPSPIDAMTRQLGLFPMAYTMSGQSPITMQTTQDLDKYLRGLYGKNMSGPFDYLAAANATRYSGYGLNTAEFAMNQKAAGNMYALTGMNNVMGAQAGADLRSGTYSSRLSDIGIFTNDLQTGAPKDVGTIVDELWDRFYPGNQNITLEDIEVDLASGYLGNNLQQLFGDNPGLYMQIVEGFRLKAKAKGRRGIKWSADAKDKNSAAAVMEQYGVMDTEVNKNILLGEGVAANTENLASASPGLLGGFDAAQEYIIGFNKALADATEALGPFANAMYGVKGFFQIFSGSPEGAMPLKILGALMGLIPGMASGGDASGHVNIYRGSSTSDSVPAMLSRGEYVINARSASILGTDYLDQLNSTGSQFGSGFAQPMRFFNNGGKVVEYGYTKHTIEGTVPDDRGGFVTAGEGTLDGWSALLSGDPALKSYQIPGSSLTLTLLERDGIGHYLADFAAPAWPAHPKLRKARHDLSARGQSGGHQARTTGHGGVSNHAAGVAMDLRWDVYHAHDGDVYDPTNEETAAIRDLLSRFSKLEWGGDWVGPGNEDLLDEMHFEIENPATWGRGGHVAEGISEDKPSTTGTQLPKVSGVMATTSGGGGGPESLMNPMLAAQGVSARWAKAFSLAPHGKRGNVLSTISHSLFPGMLAGAALTLYGGAAALMGSVGTSGVGAESESASDGEDSNIDLSVNAASGSGPEWLYQFLVAKGARGDLLRQLWTIAMRESGGNPNLIANIGVKPPSFNYPNVPDNFTFDPKDKYGYNGHEMDVGLFQINSEAHFDKVGGNMLNVIDPNDNFAMMNRLSGGFKNWTPWGIKSFNGDSISYIDWSSWGSSWTGPNGWGAATEEDTQTYWEQYKDYNREGYSKGAWRTKDEVAQIHDGEMIIPANAAEEFRKMMLDAVSGGRAGGGDVTINLSIAQASEAEAIRFAHRVKALLKDDDRILTMRNR